MDKSWIDDNARHTKKYLKGVNGFLAFARVALGTIISTNPKTIIGGVPLGKQYCEVVVNHVLKRDTTLPRTYPGVEKMGDAHRLPIAWPYNRVKQQASKSSQGVSAGGEKN